jgi:polyhydroxyalkanoate synthesis regulator phasin
MAEPTGGLSTHTAGILALILSTGGVIFTAWANLRGKRAEVDGTEKKAYTEGAFRLSEEALKLIHEHTEAADAKFQAKTKEIQEHSDRVIREIGEKFDLKEQAYNTQIFSLRAEVTELMEKLAAVDKGYTQQIGDLRLMLSERDNAHQAKIMEIMSDYQAKLERLFADNRGEWSALLTEIKKILPQLNTNGGTH